METGSSNVVSRSTVAPIHTDFNIYAVRSSTFETQITSPGTAQRPGKQFAYRSTASIEQFRALKNLLNLRELSSPQLRMRRISGPPLLPREHGRAE